MMPLATRGTGASAVIDHRLERCRGPEEGTRAVGDVLEARKEDDVDLRLSANSSQLGMPSASASSENVIASAVRDSSIGSAQMCATAAAAAREAAFAAHAAARETAGAAVDAARAAGHAAATAHMADHELRPAFDALRAVVKESNGDKAAVERERRWQVAQLSPGIKDLVLDDMRLRSKKFRGVFESGPGCTPPKARL